MTRGEWSIKVTKYPDIKTYIILEKNLRPDHVYSGKYYSVCSLDSKEDAHLISAAPDMYEALADTISFMDTLIADLPRYEDAKELRITIGKAIAKAEGK